MVRTNFFSSNFLSVGLGQFLTLALLGGISSHLQAAPNELECSQMLDGKRMTLVVPFGAGGGYDTYARMFAPVLELHSGARVRVRNVTGAGGMLGIRAVADARPDTLTLGVFNPISIIDSGRAGIELPAPDDFATLGSFIMDTTIAVSRIESDLPSITQELIIVGVGETELIRNMLATGALGWNSRLIHGYSGSADRWLALLRGDIDVVFGTTESLANYLQSTDEARAVVSITNGPNPEFPDIPYLFGDGGLIYQHTAQLPPEQRQQRLLLAQLAVELSYKPRSINITSRVDESLRMCLTDAVGKALFSDEMEKTVAAQNLAIEPSTGDDVQLYVDHVIALMRENSNIIEAIVSQVSDDN